jgi:hypothetical protein
MRRRSRRRVVVEHVATFLSDCDDRERARQSNGQAAKEDRVSTAVSHLGVSEAINGVVVAAPL